MFDKKLTLANGVEIPQLALGTWLIDDAPKTANPAHMKTNADVDFIISDADMQTLKTVKHIENYGDHSFFPVFGGKF